MTRTPPRRPWRRARPRRAAAGRDRAERAGLDAAEDVAAVADGVVDVGAAADELRWPSAVCSVSSPALPAKWSTPAPPTRTSSPAPPAIESGRLMRCSVASPAMRSAPAPPTSATSEALNETSVSPSPPRSRPLSPTTRSTSAPGVPNTVRCPDLPVMAISISRRPSASLAAPGANAPPAWSRTTPSEAPLAAAKTPTRSVLAVVATIPPPAQFVGAPPPSRTVRMPELTNDPELVRRWRRRRWPA